MNGDVAIARISATELKGYSKANDTWDEVWTFSGGADSAAIDARVKEFARAGSTTKPLATDIALDPHDGYLANTTYEIGQNIAGGVRRPQWVPRPPSSAGFFISLTTRPTPAADRAGWVGSRRWPCTRHTRRWAGGGLGQVPCRVRPGEGRHVRRPYHPSAGKRDAARRRR